MKIISKKMFLRNVIKSNENTDNRPEIRNKKRFSNNTVNNNLFQHKVSRTWLKKERS